MPFVKKASIAAKLGLAARDAYGQLQDLDVAAGRITPASPLYSAETMKDRIAVRHGWKPVGRVAQERAAEARQMYESGDEAGMRQAIQECVDLLQYATVQDADGVSKALAVVTALQAKTSFDAFSDTVQDRIADWRQRIGDAA